MIVILDYGAGNLRSVARAVAHLGYAARLSSDPADVRRAGALIVPGQGAAGECMRCLADLRLTDLITGHIAAGRPFLGVCLGLQALFDHSDEDGGQRCLGVIPGAVRQLPPGLKVPHMGWNQVRLTAPHPVMEGIPDGSDFYFVHSYYADPADRSWVLGETEYGVNFCSMVARGALVATQFHPEKSGAAGLKLYDNFLRQNL